ncbi:MAG: hypothetical protein WBG43_12635 [Marinifilaceae bacterium]
MNTFSNIKEIISTLNKEHKLLSEMFSKRKSLSYRYDEALSAVDDDKRRMDFLIERSVIRKNGAFLEIDDQYIQFFEQILEVNEEINISYINENIQNIRDNIVYYFNEKSEQRKYHYLRIIKKTLRSIGVITLRNVVDLRRNIDTTFKNEPNYNNKKAKLENLDTKRLDISKLIDDTYALINEEEAIFFKTAQDEELGHIVVELKLNLIESSHNLIEIEKQIIDFLNQIKYQTNVIEKIRRIKYLKDQLTIESTTDINDILLANNSIVFEPNSSRPLNLSLEFLASDEEVFSIIKKVAGNNISRYNSRIPVAENISTEYLETTQEEESSINLEELRDSFLLSENNLFDFLIKYNFLQDVSFDERVTIYCQMVSQYDSDFVISDDFQTENNIEYNMIYSKQRI